MIKFLFTATCLALAGSLTLACSTAPLSIADKAEMRRDARNATAKARAQDVGLAKTLDSAHAYAVFPKVGKGGVGVGGAYGKGVVFQGGQAIGYCDLSQATIGLQFGAQTYTEILCFQDQRALQRFKDGDMALDAQATVVAMDAGSGANADYRDGVAVFTTDEKGLMAEASVGGQKFTYEAI